MSTKGEAIDLRNISPRAMQVIENLAITTGLEDNAKVIQELAFSMMEMLDIIDLTKDPLLEPETARRQTETMRGILQRYKRFPSLKASVKDAHTQ
jgi:hypothetical protein